MECEFQQYFKDKVLDIRRIEHKGNNQLFEITTNDKKYLLKKYSIMQKDGWNRGKTEFNALSNFFRMGITEVPCPINFYDRESIGIYSFEQGRPLSPEEVNERYILESSNFLSKLHRLPLGDKMLFPLERTPCLCIMDYLGLIEKRYYDISEDFYGTEDSKNFLEKSILPKIDEVKGRIMKSVSKTGLLRQLSLEEQVVTPGDFGFHNMLVSPEKTVFVDFEYCGRDDPVKQILDFVHHDKNRNLENKLKILFIKNYLNQIELGEPFMERLKLLNSAIGMNWVLIYLNVLSKNYLKHLQFSHSEIDKIIQERVIKARNKLSWINQYPDFNLF